MIVWQILLCDYTQTKSDIPLYVVVSISVTGWDKQLIVAESHTTAVSEHNQSNWTESTSSTGWVIWYYLSNERIHPNSQIVLFLIHCQQNGIGVTAAVVLARNRPQEKRVTA